ncbi:MAG: isoprenylcysteine carboxylmethyltransferase family protein [Methanomicrobiales archaeon]|jgi:protein-S-isoprenylcysteine O-methyltransferase Ste14|nr:isoprenylcysteine carboxylmethyltransferase family protein [Methanomicrobiales archaeon]
MTIQNVISVFLFALFIVIVLIRAAILRRRGIRTIVFGQTDKSDFVLVPLVLAIAYTVLAGTFGLPIWDVLIHPLFTGDHLGWIGLTLCLIATACFILTLVSFGDSFRVGIDTNKPSNLITGGMFAISRNPIYVCFLLFLTGLFFIHANIVIAVMGILFVLAIHRQILREEKFLGEHYGAEYEAYCKKVRRYV